MQLSATDQEIVNREIDILMETINRTMSDEIKRNAEEVITVIYNHYLLNRIYSAAINIEIGKVIFKNLGIEYTKAWTVSFRFLENSLNDKRIEMYNELSVKAQSLVENFIDNYRIRLDQDITPVLKDFFSKHSEMLETERDEMIKLFSEHGYHVNKDELNIIIHLDKDQIFAKFLDVFNQNIENESTDKSLTIEDRENILINTLEGFFITQNLNLKQRADMARSIISNDDIAFNANNPRFKVEILEPIQRESINVVSRKLSVDALNDQLPDIFLGNQGVKVIGILNHVFNFQNDSFKLSTTESLENFSSIIEQIKNRYPEILDALQPLGQEISQRLNLFEEVHRNNFDMHMFSRLLTELEQRPGMPEVFAVQFVKGNLRLGENLQSNFEENTSNWIDLLISFETLGQISSFSTVDPEDKKLVEQTYSRFVDWNIEKIAGDLSKCASFVESPIFRFAPTEVKIKAIAEIMALNLSGEDFFHEGEFSKDAERIIKLAEPLSKLNPELFDRIEDLQAQLITANEMKAAKLYLPSRDDILTPVFLESLDRIMKSTADKIARITVTSKPDRNTSEDEI
ncbi:MAG: hypothetical protein LBJ93_04460 [Clostridiales bacterium]|jgi:hypothetical protein|nr:hypothetical protein [Clostridiales bacterium]